MVQTGPRNLANRVVCSLPGFGQSGALASHSEHSSTSGNEFAIGIGPNTSAEHRDSSDCLRVVKTFNDIAGAQVSRITLGSAHNSDSCAVIEGWCSTKLACSG
jgi:hypothetical protein